MKAQNNKKAAAFTPSNSANKYQNNTRFPLTFERLVPGSEFRMCNRRGGELVLGTAIYRKSTRGYFAERIDNNDGAVLYPEELVMPVVKVKG